MNSRFGHWKVPRLSPLVLGVPFLLLSAPLSSAQTATGQARWEAEFRIGSIFTSRPPEGVPALPQAGPSFTTFSGLPSRRVPSWFFGDGARLFNSLPGSLRQDESIAPLDPALFSGARAKAGWTLGVRLGYDVNSRFSVELAADYGLVTLELDSGTLRDIEASRASFQAAWSGFTSAVSSSLPIALSTTTNVSDTGLQLLTVGMVKVKLTREHRVTPFLIAGGGIVTQLAAQQSVTLDGFYGFRRGLLPVIETDVVTVRYSLTRGRLVGVVGGGITYAVASRFGVRTEARAYLGEVSVSTTVDATPSVAVGGPTGTIATNTNPSIQFSNNPSFTGRESTLSGGPIREFETFHGTEVSSNVSVSIGWYVRF